MDRQEIIEGIINSHANYMKEWLNLLCNTDERMALFLDCYNDIKNLENLMQNFQCYLNSTGRGLDITARQLQDCINRRDYIIFKELIQEVLLIPVDNETLRMLMRKNKVKLLRKCRKYSNVGCNNITDRFISLQLKI